MHVGYVTNELSTSKSCFINNGSNKYEIVAPEHSEIGLICFNFKAKENAELLQDDVNGLIVGDSIVECWIPYLMPNKFLKPKILYTGGANY